MSGYLNNLVEEIHRNAVEKGWWDDERKFGEIVALCHSELSEALEEYRKGHKPTAIYFPDANGYGPHANSSTEAMVWAGNYAWKPEGIPIELADVIIRICDYAGMVGIDLDEAIRLKLEYNKTRPHRHGGKII